MELYEEFMKLLAVSQFLKLVFKIINFKIKYFVIFCNIL